MKFTGNCLAILCAIVLTAACNTKQGLGGIDPTNSEDNPNSENNNEENNEENNGPIVPPPPPPNLGKITKELQTEWSGCMDLDAWLEEGVSEIWANKRTSSLGMCGGCHERGANGFVATPANPDAEIDPREQAFNLVATNPGFMRNYFSVDISDLENPRMVPARDRLRLVGQSAVPHAGHPRFTVDGAALDALDTYYNRIVARKEEGLCGPPRLIEE